MVPSPNHKPLILSSILSVAQENVIEMKKYAIIGSGPAGAVAAETLRKLDDESEITVVTSEACPFYRRDTLLA
jgi:hypothetical protein